VKKIIGFLILTVLALTFACAPPPADKADVSFRPIRERAEIISKLNTDRVNRLLLPTMRRHGIDCWVIMSREFNKDFVQTYIEDTIENKPGGHRNAYIFYDDGSDTVRRVALGTHLPHYSKLWDKSVSYHRGEGENGPSLAPILKETIEKINPKKIAVNQSRTIPMCDGLTVEMKKFLVESIGPKYAARLVSAEPLIVDFLDTRMPEEREYFREAAELSKYLHQDILSSDLITPGETTIGDLRWHLLNRMDELHLTTWYFNGLRVIREGEAERLDAESTVIQPGDLINNDIGVVYMNFHTDFKGTGYVLKPGENEVPAGLKQAFANSLRVQDAIFEVSRPGDIGHTIVAEAENLCREWGIEGVVYCHSTGIPGHGIGSSMCKNWPDRYGVRPTFPLRLGSYYAIESHAFSVIPEWGGQKISIPTEEDAYLTEDGFVYAVPRQEEIWLIR